MTIAEATRLRDEYIKKLVGKPYDGRRPDWAIKDIIVAGADNAKEVYNKMYEENLSNETALGLFSIAADKYDALIIAHPVTKPNGEMIIEKVQHYINANQS